MGPTLFRWRKNDTAGKLSAIKLGISAAPIVCEQCKKVTKY